MESSQSAGGLPPPPHPVMLFPPLPPPSTSNHHQYANNYPLKNIPQPHPHDVLCGRGGGTNAHIGNSHWRMLVSTNKELYVTLPKRQKMLLSKSIVNAVRSQHPPGRFLQKDPQTELWYDVGDQRAQEKTSQALREGAPDIRSKLKPAAKATTATAANATLSATSSLRRRKSGSTDGEDETISPKSAATSVASSVSPPLPSLSMPSPFPPTTSATAMDGSRSEGTDDEPMPMYSAAPASGGIAPPLPPPPLPMMSMPNMILNQSGQPVPSVGSQISSLSSSASSQQPPVPSATLPLPYPSSGMPPALLPPPVVGGAPLPSLPQPIPPQGPVPEKNRRKKTSSTSPAAAGAATTSTPTTTSNSATSSQASISTTSTTLTPTAGNPAATTDLDNDNNGCERSAAAAAAAAAPAHPTSPPDPIPSTNDDNNNGDHVIVMMDRNDDDNDQPKPTKEEAVVRVPHEKEEDVDDVAVVEDVEPPAGLDPEAQFSFGSIALTDMEQAKLMNGFSIGSAISYIHQADQQHHHHHQQNNETISEPPAQRNEASPKREDASHAACHSDHYHYPQHHPYHSDTPPALGTYQQQDLYPSKQQYPQYQQQQFDSFTPSEHYPLHHQQQQPHTSQHPYDHHSSKRYPQAEPQYHHNHQPNESQTAYFEQHQAECQFHQQTHGPPVFDDQPQPSRSQHYHPYGPQYSLPTQHDVGPSYHNHDSNYYSYTKSDLCDRGTTASDCRGPFSESLQQTTPPKEMMPPPPPSGVPASVQYPPQQHQGQQQHQKHYQDHHAYHQHHHQVPYPPSHVTPVDGGLEPAGLSFGSVMSIGTADPMKLEPAGLSFGSVMSYSVAKGGPGSGGGTGGGSGSCVPDAVDGGLEAIGTSFGSLSLNTNDPKLLDTFREDQPNCHGQFQPSNHQLQQLHEQQLHEQQETAAVQAAPTFLRAQKSRGSLLECSDTDSDDEEKSAHISYQKSVEWEKLKAVLAQQPSQPQPPLGSIRGVGVSTTRDTAFAAMPPPATLRPTTLNIPSTTFDRDFSQMSAISVGGDFDGGNDDNYTPYSLGGDYFYQPQVMPPVRKTALHESDSSGGCNEMPPPPPAMKKHDSGEW